MAVTARFTEQIVILTTPERAAWIKERAEHYGVSQAQIARDCIDMGAEALVVEYKRRGLGPAVRPVATKRVSKAREPRVSQKGHAPGRALLVSPGGEPMDPADLRPSVTRPV